MKNPAFRRATPAHKQRAGLRALVPSAYNAEGESDPALRAYKSKWLSKLNFTSHENVQSLLLLSFMVLALGRDAEAEMIADQLIRHTDLRPMPKETRVVIATALYLSAWLKSKRKLQAPKMLERAKALGKASVQQDREWLSNDAAREIHEALERKKIGDIPFAGILRWVNEGSAKAEALLAAALDVTKSLMK